MTSGDKSDPPKIESESLPPRLSRQDKSKRVAGVICTITAGLFIVWCVKQQAQTGRNYLDAAAIALLAGGFFFLIAMGWIR